MTWKKQLMGLMVLAAALAAPLQADCNGEPCVLVYRGAVTQSTAASPDGTWVKEVELADVDGDGWLDLFMLQKQPLVPWLGVQLQIRPQNNRDLIYLSRGAAHGGLNFELDDPLPDAFALKADAFPTNFLTTRGYDAELADLDGDGHLDLVRPDTPGILRVLWGDGTGRFAQVDDVFAQIGGDPNDTIYNCTVGFIPPGINAGGNYDDVAVADCGNDGDLDFVVAQYHTCGRSLLIENRDNNGSPRTFSFTDMAALAARNTHSVSFGNANPGANGNLDVLLTHGSGFDPEIYFGTSPDCTFQTTSKFTFGALANSQPTTIGDITDLDGDAVDDPDVFLAKGLDGGDFGLYVNSGNPGTPFANITRIPGCPGASCPDASKYDVRYGDLDGDGQIEAVTANINVSENCCVDANGDCQDCNLGLPVGTSFIEDTVVQVFRFEASGSFSAVSDEFVDGAYTGNLGGIAVAFGDLDNDGDDDVVLGGVVDEPSGTPGDVNLYGAAHLYENRTQTRLQNRTISSGQLDLLALDTLAAGNGVTLSGSAQVRFEAGKQILLQDGFTANPGSGGEFVARILP